MLVLAGLTLVGVAAAFGILVWVVHAVRKCAQRTRQFLMLLEKQNRDLDAFAGRVAHDLRAPLTNIGLTSSRLVWSRIPGRVRWLTLHRAVARMASSSKSCYALGIGTESGDARCDPATVAESIREELAPRMPNEGNAAAEGRVGDHTVQRGYIAAGALESRRERREIPAPGLSAIDRYRRTPCRLDLRANGFGQWDGHAARRDSPRVRTVLSGRASAGDTGNWAGPVDGQARGRSERRHRRHRRRSF